MSERLETYLLYAVLVFGGILFFILEETIRLKNTGFETKTLWDWLELLIIPLFLAGGAFFLNRSERNNEREIEKDRQQEAALQAYLDRMTALLLEQKLLTSKKKEVGIVASVRTLSTIRGLDKRRKRMVVTFLSEADLISIVDLTTANLEGIRLSYTNLKSAKMQAATLERADFLKANLQGANLKYTLLSRANFMDADLQNANMEGAFMIGAIFYGANLQDANLKDAFLKDAMLSNANLQGADLTGADLQGAEVSNAQLEQAKSLQGATLPNGTKHE